MAASQAIVRRLAPMLVALLTAVPAQAQEVERGPSTLLSRCAGKAGGEFRQGDPAFVTIALDGRPWMTIEQTDSAVGIQPISTTVTGSGWRQRRDGTSVHFRFTCALDERGQAVLFHASTLLRDLGDRLPPAIVVEGAAAYPDKAQLQRGVELQVQLIDLAQPPASRILAEQVVRSGWHVPIPFSLRLSKETALADRNLAISARLVLGRRTLFELDEQRVAVSDLSKFLALTLAKASVSER
jgi:hypothetical protein